MREKENQNSANFPLDTFLVNWTGCNSAHWIKWIEATIQSHVLVELSDKQKEELNILGGKGMMDENKDWIGDLSRELMRIVPASGDGNLVRASCVAVILCYWFASVCRAKSRDPKRKEYDQRIMQDGAFRYLQLVVMQALTDDSADPLNFPNQDWELPFAIRKKRKCRKK